MDFTEPSPHYDHFDAKGFMTARNGNQEGDPLKAAKAIYDLAVMPEPPLRIVIGTDAYAKIIAKLNVDKELAFKYKELSNSTNVDNLCLEI